MRILIIDDDVSVTNTLNETLKSEGFVLDTADDGERGLYLAKSNEYDIIILDNCLPKKDGIEVCVGIRASGNTTPIIILSVLSSSEQKTVLINAGADDYITKPYSHQELLARIRALLRRPQIIEEEIITLDDLTLDTKRHIAQRGKKEIKLTRKEFGLLEYLLRNTGITLTRGVLMEHVWDMNADPFSNTIESHISSLRRKIESKNKIKLIHTVPGYGYKIDV